MRGVGLLALAVCLGAALAITVVDPRVDVRKAIPSTTHVGITFKPNGDLYTMQNGGGPNRLFCRYPGAFNLPIGSQLTMASNAQCGAAAGYATGTAIGITATGTGRMYTADGYEILGNGPPFAATRRWPDCGGTNGIAIDPRNGDIFISSNGFARVWKFPNPDTNDISSRTCASSIFFNGNAAGVGGFDGITVGPDGTVYVAGWTNNRFVIINTDGTLRSANPTTNASPDGISICFDDGESFALIAMTRGSISRFALSGAEGHPIYKETTAASNMGGYLDFSAVDPKGCIWGTTLDGEGGIYRVTNADGSCGCASPQVPDPDCFVDGDCASDGCSKGVCVGGVCSSVAQPAGTVCRAPAGVCDVVETCDGTSQTCPSDSLAGAETTCRAPVDACDAAEICSGASASCPADGKVGNGVPCRPASGACDVPEVCDGSSDSCPADVVKGVNTECRAADGVCDVAEVCDGLSGACPADAVAPTETECRAADGVCDVAETCDGATKVCPANAFNSGRLCRVKADDCDVTEVCDGSSAECPADGFASATTECRAADGGCDVAEFCTGTAAECPADSISPFNTVCRSVAGACDVPEVCDGNSKECPANLFRCATEVCRVSAGPCDVAEKCTGFDAQCPVDKFKPRRTTCRCEAGPCDEEETCTGSDAQCPPDGVKPANTECRASRGACDAAETCDGQAKTCPSDKLKPFGAVCRAAVGSCDLEEKCDGCTATCPKDKLKPKNTVCRCAVGVCDEEEKCDGRNGACPADKFKSSRTVCRDSCAPCDATEYCPGNGASCPADGFKPRGSVCRAAAGDCDVAETCSGTSNSCPVNAVVPAGTVCRAARSKCDLPEKCSGASPSCPADEKAEYGYSYKCEKECFVCGNDLKDQVTTDRRTGQSSCGGCSLGRCNSVTELPWPACLNLNINSQCQNGKELTSVEFYKCKNGSYQCKNRFEGPKCKKGFKPNYDKYCN